MPTQMEIEKINDDADTPANEGFFDGDYLIVGQKMANGSTYKGHAHIKTTNQHTLLLSRTINGITTIEKGILFSDSVGNENKVPMPKFNWRDAHGDAEMFCYFTSSFDNYPLLSCLRYYVKDQKNQPGFENYYPAAIYSK